MISKLQMIPFAMAQELAYPHLSKAQSESLFAFTSKICSDTKEFTTKSKNARLTEAYERHCVKTKPPSLTGLIVAFYHLNVDAKGSQKEEKLFYKSRLPIMSFTVRQTPDFAAPKPAWDVSGIVDELSGLAYDKKRNIFWSLGDSGTGEKIGRTNARTFSTESIKVTGGKNHDWEAIAVDSKFMVWILDVGDNVGARKKVRLYRINPDEIAQGTVKINRELQVQYDGKAHDVEAAVVEGDSLYLIGKEYYKPVRIDKVDISESAQPKQKAIALGETPEAPPITDAFLTENNRLMALTYFGVFEIQNWKDPTKRSFKQINHNVWGQTEALSSIDSKTFFVGSEDGSVFKTEIQKTN
jgi:hypothetical protein